MNGPDNITFKDERVLVTDAELAGWNVTERNDDDAPIEVAGPCPCCGHHTVAELALDVIGSRALAGEGLDLPPARERITRIVTCACGLTHPRPVPAADAAADATPPAPPTEPACGRWWLASIVLEKDVEQPVRAGDESLLQAAQAVKAELANEEKRITDAADKWIAGVAAVLSLFGLSGVIVGKDALDSIPTVAAVFAAVLAGLALMSAAAAVVWSYRAAYGWPTPVDLSNDEALRTWFEQRRERIAGAAADLKDAVRAALFALGVLALALAIVWFWPRDAAKPMVKVTNQDDSFVCGTLLSTEEDEGTLRVRNASGEVKLLRAAAVSKIAVVSKC